MEKTYNIDSICSVVKQDWKSLSPALHAVLESMYAAADLQPESPLSNKLYYLSALYTITRMARPRHSMHIGTAMGCVPLSMAVAMRDYGISGVIDTISIDTDADAVALPNTIEHILQNSKLSPYVRMHTSSPSLSTPSITPSYSSNTLIHAFVERNSTDLVILDAEHAIDGIFRDIDISGRTLRTNGPSLIFVYNHLSTPGTREALFYWKRLHAASILFREFPEHNGFSIIQYYKEAAISPQLGAPQHMFSF